jgi:ketosteroid isomerase-like protein
LTNQEMRDAIDGYFAALDARDFDLAAGYIAQDARWWIPRSAEPMLGIELPLIGREAVIKLLSGGLSRYARFEHHIEGSVAEDDVIAIRSRSRGTTLAGADYDMDYCFFYRFEDGVIAEGWEYADTVRLRETNALSA